MGCGSSKPEYDQGAIYAQPKPVGTAPQYPQSQPQQSAGKKKAVKAGKNLGLLSMLAG